jgi:integrase
VFPVLTTYVVANWSSQQTSAEKTFRFLIGNLSHFRIRLPEPAATIFATAAFTGLRRGEIRGLRWENYCDGEIRVTQSIWEGHTTEPKTFQSGGAVPIIRSLAKMLDSHRLRGLGSNLYALGIHEKTIQSILRHANVSPTNTYYIKTAPADALAAMAKLESAIPQLGNSWATESETSQLPVAIN